MSIILDEIILDVVVALDELKLCVTFYYLHLPVFVISIICCVLVP